MHRWKQHGMKTSFLPGFVSVPGHPYLHYSDLCSFNMVFLDFICLTPDYCKQGTSAICASWKSPSILNGIALTMVDKSCRPKGFSCIESFAGVDGCCSFRSKGPIWQNFGGWDWEISKSGYHCCQAAKFCMLHSSAKRSSRSLWFCPSGRHR